MSRLTKKYGDKIYFDNDITPLTCSKPKFCKKTSCSYAGDREHCPFLMLLYKLAKLEDKIENKTLIELPCKVGDKVYRKDGVWNVVGFECDRANGWKVKLERWADKFLDLHQTTKVVFSALGKTVFLTEKEAKEAFKKGATDEM